MGDDAVFTVADPAEQGASVRDLPAHLAVADDGRVRCRDCETPAQLRPVVHEPDCPHTEVANGGA